MSAPHEQVGFGLKEDRLSWLSEPPPQEFFLIEQCYDWGDEHALPLLPLSSLTHSLLAKLNASLDVD
jgi:hypothetical protein